MWRLVCSLLWKWGGWGSGKKDDGLGRVNYLEVSLGGWGSGKKDDDGKMRNIYNVRARGIFRLWGGGF